MSSFASNAICTDDILCSRELLEETVNVINQAIHAESESANDSSEEAIGERICNGRTLRVLVFDSQDFEEEEAVDIRFEEKEVSVVRDDSDVVADAKVKVCKDHLRKVCTNPEFYADDPLKIELVWMKERMTA